MSIKYNWHYKCARASEIEQVLDEITDAGYSLYQLDFRYDDSVGECYHIIYLEAFDSDQCDEEIDLEGF